MSSLVADMNRGRGGKKSAPASAARQLPVQISIPAPVTWQVPVQISTPAPVTRQVPMQIAAPAPVARQLPVQISTRAPVTWQVPVQISAPAPVTRQVPVQISAPASAGSQLPRDAEEEKRCAFSPSLGSGRALKQFDWGSIDSESRHSATLHPCKSNSVILGFKKLNHRWTVWTQMQRVKTGQNHPGCGQTNPGCGQTSPGWTGAGVPRAMP